MMTTATLIEQFNGATEPDNEQAPSGFGQLDRITGGFTRGQVWIVTSAPGHGRTTLLTQFAVALATTHGWPTRLVCPREPRRFITARLLACVDRLPLLDLYRGRFADHQRLADAQRVLQVAPLHVATQGQSTFLDYDDSVDDLPPANAVLIDDGDLIAGVSPERVRSLARRGSLVVATLPRYLLVHGIRDGWCLDPRWARAADFILEVRQSGSVADPDNLRPGEADLILLSNRWGPGQVTRVAFQGHYSRFVELD